MADLAEATQLSEKSDSMIRWTAFLVLLAFLLVSTVGYLGLSLYLFTSNSVAQDLGLGKVESAVNQLQTTYANSLHIVAEASGENLGVNQQRVLQFRSDWNRRVDELQTIVNLQTDRGARGGLQQEIDRINYLGEQFIVQLVAVVAAGDNQQTAAMQNFRRLSQQMVETFTRINERLQAIGKRNFSALLKERQVRQQVLLVNYFLLLFVTLAAIISMAFTWQTTKRLKVARLNDIQTLSDAHNRAEIKANAKSNFLANMSHEIRTMMNGIIGMTELLVGTKLDERQQKYAGTVQRSSETLMNIINSVLDYSKIESGKIQMLPKVFDLRDLMESAVSVFQSMAEKKSIRTNLIFPQRLHTVYLADSERMQQIFLNLISNAFKFTDRGEVNIDVSLLREDATHNELQFNISDTGIGILPEAREQIFEPYGSDPNDLGMGARGSGLGLAISKQLVQLMGGEIGVDSRPGLGSNFWVRLSLKKESQTKLDVVRDALTALKILVVDDYEANRDVLSNMLMRWKVDVDAVPTINEARARLEVALRTERPYHVVLLDHAIGNDNGLVFAQELNENPTHRALRKVMVSSLVGAISLVERSRAGIDAFLHKPIRQTELYAILSRIHQQLFSNQASAAAAQVPQIHVLIAEDNPINRELTETMLQLSNVKVETVENGLQALSRVEAFFHDPPSQHLDLVLMDCQMPEMDGYTASQKIRELEAKLQRSKRLPIVALTANVLEGDRERCIGAGMDDHLGKPFTQGQLGAIVERWTHATTKVDTVDSPIVGGDSKMTHTQLDAQALDQIRALELRGQKGLLAKVISLFLAETPILIERIEQSVHENDASRLRITAHTLKSSAMSMGATKLSDLCVEFEAMGRGDVISISPAKLQAFRDEYAAVCEALKAEAEASA